MKHRSPHKGQPESRILPLSPRVNEDAVASFHRRARVGASETLYEILLTQVRNVHGMTLGLSVTYPLCFPRS